MNDDFDGMLYFDKERIRATLINTVTQQGLKGVFESVLKAEIPAEIKNCVPEVVLQQMRSSLAKFTPDALNLLISQFTGFVTDDYDKRMAFISQVAQNQKIACLSSGIESAAMWGYYANDGTGFALSYDLRELDFSKYCLVPVIYGEERFNATKYAEWLLQQQTLQRILMNANAYTMYSLIQKTIPCPDQFMSTKILIHKASSWSHEREWRLIFYEKNEQKEKYPHISKRPTAIYLGKNISEIHEKILRHIAEKNNVPVYKMIIRDNEPTYRLFPQVL